MAGRGHEVRLLISEKQVDADASAKYGELRFETMPAVAKPPTRSLRMLPFLWKLWSSMRHCKHLIQDLGADAVLGMGGFTSLPPVYAGHRLGLKTFIHDSNARPGRANLLTSRFCTRVLLGLEPAKAFFPNRETQLTGTPARPEILTLPSRAAAAARFGLDPARPVIVITGGSQGAHRLNDLSAAAATSLPPETQVLHLAGALDCQRISEMTQGRPGYRVLGFCDQMAAVYAVADLIIARAGASCLTELAIAGLPAILVPYPYAADDHQTHNAEVFAEAGAAKLIQERDLDPSRLAAMATEILGNAETRTRMAAAARTIAIPDAAARVCSAIETTLSPS